MKPQSIHALIWFSIILMVAGWLVMSPLASLLIVAIVLLCSLPILFFGVSVQRFIGVLLLAAALGKAAIHYPKAREQMNEYRHRMTTAPISAPTNPKANR